MCADVVLDEGELITLRLTHHCAVNMGVTLCDGDVSVEYSYENERGDLPIYILFRIFVTFNSDEHIGRNHGIKHPTDKTSQPAISGFTIQISRRFSCMDGGCSGTTA